PASNSPANLATSSKIFAVICAETSCSVRTRKSAPLRLVRSSFHVQRKKPQPAESGVSSARRGRRGTHRLYSPYYDDTRQLQQGGHRDEDGEGHEEQKRPEQVRKQWIDVRVERHLGDREVSDGVDVGGVGERRAREREVVHRGEDPRREVKR